MTVTFAEGEPYWVDVSVLDVPAGTAFYRRLFGWEAHDLGEESGHYTMFSHDGKLVAALGPCFGPEPIPEWSVFFKVSDPYAVTAAVTKAGGTVTMEPMDVFDQTTLAAFTDPHGGRFQISQPKGHQGAQLWSAPGSPCWIEYSASHPKTDLHFYQDVFGWQVYTPEWETDTDNPYQALSAAGAEREFGGSHVAEPGEPTQSWGVVFGVEDVDEIADHATELGGKVLGEPMDMPGPTRFATLADAEGAVFSVMSEAG